MALYKNPFKLITPIQVKAPILISSPHSGVKFPEEEIRLFKDEVLKHPMDTDWFIDDLYSFAESLGLPSISAQYSRYVVDLNRPVQSQSLYDDGRKETGLFPKNSFLGTPIYKDTAALSKDIEDLRMRSIYEPYYEAIHSKLRELKEEFGYAILFDAHSIKSQVETIQKVRFPHFIVGTNDGLSCLKHISDIFLNHLRSRGELVVNENHPFKGGNITRHFGGKEPGVWAIQLEMSQDLYLDESTDQREDKKFNNLASFLKEGIEKLMRAPIE